MITEKIADFLADLRPFTIEITLYGGTKETYEKLTGIPGSYDRCMRGIDLLLERKLPLKLKTVALSINKHEIPLMRQMAADRGVRVHVRRDDQSAHRLLGQSAGGAAQAVGDRGARSRQSPTASRSGGGWRAIIGRRPYVEGEVAADLRMRRRRQLASPSIRTAISRSAFCRTSTRTTCATATSAKVGRTTSSACARARSRGRRSAPAADLKSMCGMCAANGELENGDAESPVDFLCQVAHLRAETLDIPVPAHGDCEYCVGGSGHAARARRGRGAEVRRSGTDCGDSV